MTSGAIYSSVPTNEFVRRFAVHALVSMTADDAIPPKIPLRPPLGLPKVGDNIAINGDELLLTMVGDPGTTDGLDKSKSVNMM